MTHGALALTLLLVAHVSAAQDRHDATLVLRAAYGVAGGDNGSYGTNIAAALREIAVGQRLSKRTTAMAHVLDVRADPPSRIACPNAHTCRRWEQMSVSGIAMGAEHSLPTDRWIVSLKASWNGGLYLLHHNTPYIDKAPTMVWPGVGAGVEFALRVLPFASLSLRVSDLVLVRTSQAPLNVYSGALVLRAAWLE